jgi:hypothetical protein
MAVTTRVVLADDDVLLRAGLASLLEGAGFEVVGQAGDGEQLISLVRGAIECRYRASHLGHRRHRRKAYPQHHEQVEPA